MKPAAASRGLRLLVDDRRSEAADWRRHVERADAATRLALFDRYLGFARHIARDEFRRIAALGLERADAEQVAMEALLQAIDRYDPLQAVPFTAFARMRIRGAIRNALAKATEANAAFSARKRAERDRLASLKAAATARDPLELVRELAMGIALGFMLEDDGGSALEQAPTGDPSAYDALSWKQLLRELDQRIAALPEREAMIVESHYRRGIAFGEIAKLLGVSKGRVSQLHAQAIRSLQAAMAKFR